MIWNTITHPRMMGESSQPDSGTGNNKPGNTATPYPIKFADPHKLSFYDIVVSLTGTLALTGNDEHYILVKGDFETIKKMLLNDEVVCGAMFVHIRDAEVANLIKVEFTRFSYDSALDAITLQADENSDLLHLLSDNTILAATIGGNTDPTSPGTQVSY